MSTQSKRATLAVALLVAVIGLVVGLWPHSVPAGTDSLSCGSAFGGGASNTEVTGAALKSALTDGGSYTTARADLLAACDDATSTPRVFAFVLIGLGLVAAVGIGLARTDQARAV